MALKLVIGNKNYSSWSMRPWLALRANQIPFEEVFIPLYTDNQADKVYFYAIEQGGKPGDELKLRGTINLNDVGKAAIKPTKDK